VSAENPTKSVPKHFVLCQNGHEVEIEAGSIATFCTQPGCVGKQIPVYTSDGEGAYKYSKRHTLVQTGEFETE